MVIIVPLPFLSIKYFMNSSSLQHNGSRVERQQHCSVWIIENAHRTRDRKAGPVLRWLSARGKSCNANLAAHSLFVRILASLSIRYHMHGHTHTHTIYTVTMPEFTYQITCNCVIDNNPGHKYCHIQTVRTHTHTHANAAMSRRIMWKMQTSPSVKCLL